MCAGKKSRAAYVQVRSTTAVPSITFNAELRDTMPNTLTKPQVKLQPKTQRSKLYKVILLNDDYTPREFVVAVLKGVFRRPNL
jgi:ATP-dependent Clp protease adaptor protein ClpS